MAAEITGPVLLAVEGSEDRFFFEEMARQLGFAGVQCLPAGGADLKRALVVAAKTEGYQAGVRALGIVKESDVHGMSDGAAFQSACNILEHLQLPIPSGPLEIASGQKHTCVLIVQGKLEDLFLEAVAQDGAMECVDCYFDCLRNRGMSPSNPSKARWQAFLASRPEFDARSTVAIKQGHLDLCHSAFGQATTFLRQLAESAGS